MNTAIDADAQPTAMPWGDEFLLGYDPMDTIHREFVELLSLLLEAAPEQMPTLLDAVAQHTQAHFELEDSWMEETQFPPRQCHMDEHAAVLKSIHEVRSLVAQKHYGNVPSLARALADWFPGHATHLDSALAHWMCKRSLGGKPVVLRRNIPLR
jgi:hemerythrin-like metal-binding protein